MRPLFIVPFKILFEQYLVFLQWYSRVHPRPPPTAKTALRVAFANFRSRDRPEAGENRRCRFLEGGAGFPDRSQEASLSRYRSRPQRSHKIPGV